MRRCLLLFGMLAACNDEGGSAALLGPDRPDEAPLDAWPPDVALLDVALPDAARPALPDAAPIDAAPDMTPDLGPPPLPEGLPRFAFPIHPDDRSMMLPTPIFGIDHDPADGQRVVCTNYAGRGFPLCYDGHEGTDFVLQGGFTVMDRGSARIVAAAGGEVIEAIDGNYDRCHASAAEVNVSCDGHPMVANRIKIRHFDGWETRYLHLKNGSVVVRVGDLVACGDELGRVGSSGNSSLPHLHFEAHRPDGSDMDPYAGPFSQPESLWVEQEGPNGLPGDVCDRAWGAVPE